MRQTRPKSALEFQAKHATERVQGTIAVRATRRGFYDQHLKEPGDVFAIRSVKELGSWMEIVPDERVIVEEQETGNETGNETGGGEQLASGEQPATGEQAAAGEQKPPKGAKKASTKKTEPATPAPKSDNDVL